MGWLFGNSEPAKEPLQVICAHSGCFQFVDIQSEERPIQTKCPKCSLQFFVCEDSETRTPIDYDLYKTKIKYLKNLENIKNDLGVPARIRELVEELKIMEVNSSDHSLIASNSFSMDDRKEEVINELGNIGHQSVAPAFIFLLKDELNHDRVAQALSKIGGGEVVDIMQKMLNLGPSEHFKISGFGSNLHVRLENDGSKSFYPYGIKEAAAKALAKMKTPSAIEPLMTLLSEETLLDEQWIDIMNEFGTEANPRLIEYLEDDTNWQASFPEPDFDSESYDEYVSDIIEKDNRISNVISVLAESKDERAVEPLIQCLMKRGAVDATGKAAIGLGEIGDERAVKPLLDKLGKYKAGDSRLDSIAAALTLLGEKSGIPLLVKSSVMNPDSFGYNYILYKEPELVGNELEKLELYQKAEKIYTENGMLEKATEMRKKKAELGAVKVDQTVVHGDYVDDRDTIVKDSVINKSNIGSGGDDKFAKLDRLADMKEKGLIDDDEFKQMKKEILGK